MGLLSHARALPAAVDSLAGRLARTLILSVGGAWLACVLGVVWYIDREINYNFDNELVEVAHRMFDIAIEQYDAMARGHEPTQPLIAPLHPDRHPDAAAPIGRRRPKHAPGYSCRPTGFRPGRG